MPIPQLFRRDPQSGFESGEIQNQTISPAYIVLGAIGGLYTVGVVGCLIRICLSKARKSAKYIKEFGKSSHNVDLEKGVDEVDKMDKEISSSVSNNDLYNNKLLALPDEAAVIAIPEQAAPSPPNRWSHTSFSSQGSRSSADLSVMTTQERRVYIHSNTHIRPEDRYTNSNNGDDEQEEGDEYEELEGNSGLDEETMVKGMSDLGPATPVKFEFSESAIIENDHPQHPLQPSGAAFDLCRFPLPPLWRPEASFLLNETRDNIGAIPSSSEGSTVGGGEDDHDAPVVSPAAASEEAARPATMSAAAAGTSAVNMSAGTRTSTDTTCASPRTGTDVHASAPTAAAGNSTRRDRAQSMPSHYYQPQSLAQAQPPLTPTHQHPSSSSLHSIPSPRFRSPSLYTSISTESFRHRNDSMCSTRVLQQEQKLKNQLQRSRSNSLFSLTPLPMTPVHLYCPPPSPHRPHLLDRMHRSTTYGVLYANSTPSSASSSTSCSSMSPTLETNSCSSSASSIRTMTTGTISSSYYDSFFYGEQDFAKVVLSISQDKVSPAARNLPPGFESVPTMASPEDWRRVKQKRGKRS